MTERPDLFPSPALYPCPICGQEPEITTVTTFYGLRYLVSCYCSGFYSMTEDDAVHVWNLYCSDYPAGAEDCL